MNGLTRVFLRSVGFSRCMQCMRPSALSILLLTSLLSPLPLLAEGEGSFRKDIMPILFRAGCNAGTCHGAAKGKDGFMLSLFGYDAKGDYYRIVNEMVGRRINYAVPEQSLLLTKATGSVPHTGGELFTKDSEYYKTIRDWIAVGTPDDDSEVASPVGLELSPNRFVFECDHQKAEVKVTARYDDGSKRDVTSLALFHSNNTSVVSIDEFGKIMSTGSGDSHVFARFSRFTIGAEVIVLPPAEGFTWSNPVSNNYIDDIVFDRLEKLRIVPSELCDDETFLRRVTLDLSGRPPTPDEYYAFISDNSRKKRSAKIDELLASKSFTDLWTAIWSEQLRIIGGNSAQHGTHIKAADTFQKWIRHQIGSGRPLNEFVSDMVSASGSNLQNGPANLYTMMVHATRLDPKAFAADFSQVFLGVQIQCAECHNHPFDRWTMDDYYGFVSFFSGVSRKPGIESRAQRIFYNRKAEPAKHLVDNRPMPAKTLGAIEPVNHTGDPRRALASWLTSPDNELFSRNLANRIWAQIMGRGVVEPVDDVRVSNPPVNGPLLEALANSLTESNFDLRSLVRDICNSTTYQLSSTPNSSNRLDTRQFSRTYLRRLRADVLLDTIFDISDKSETFRLYAPGKRAIEVYPRTTGGTDGSKHGDQFFATFGRSGRSSVSSTEIKSEPTLSQTLHMTVGETIMQRLDLNGQLKRLVESKETPQAIIEELFVKVLCRRPSESELNGLVKLVGSATNDVEVYEDIVWGLFSSTEFMFNH